MLWFMVMVILVEDFIVKLGGRIGLAIPPS